MKTEQTVVKPVISDAELALVVTSIQKLDQYFSDEDVADKFLQPTGWLNLEGTNKLRARWTPHSLCFTLLKTSLEGFPKPHAVAQLINDKTHVFGCTISLRDTSQGLFFAIEGKNFFWFGG